MSPKRKLSKSSIVTLLNSYNVITFKTSILNCNKSFPD